MESSVLSSDLWTLREAQTRGLCPNCASELPPGARRCATCSASSTRACATCAAPLGPDARYCDVCFAPSAASPAAVLDVTASAGRSPSRPCWRCGTRNGEGAARCSACWANLEGPGGVPLSSPPARAKPPEVDVAVAPAEVAAALVELEETAGSSSPSSPAAAPAPVTVEPAGQAVPEPRVAAAVSVSEPVRTQSDPLRRCPLCGYDNASQAEFCGACWARLFVASVEAPTRLRMVVDAAAAERWEVHGVRTGFVGRARELSALAQIYEDVHARRIPRLVSLVGDAGVGKSRLFGELASWLEEHPSHPRLLSTSCRDDESEASLGPISRLLRTRLGLREHDGVLEARERAGRTVREVCVGSFADDVAETFYKFLGLSRDGDLAAQAAVDGVVGGALPVGGAENHSAMGPSTPGVYRVWGAVARFLEGDARRSPLVLCIDDAQHGTAELFGVLRHLATHLGEAPVMIVVLARPQLFAERTRLLDLGVVHHRLDLSELSPEESVRLVDGILGKAGFDVKIVRETARRGGGNPLFLEELCRVALSMGPGAHEAVLPGTVHDAVRHRLSFLSPAARGLLEKAAVIGRSFWLGALVALTRLEQTGFEADPADRSRYWFGTDESEAIRRVLEELRSRDFVARNPQATFPDEEEYVFKQGTERELVYGEVPKERASGWHRFISQWLLQRRGKADDSRLALAARHRELAGDAVGAARLYLGAADRARHTAEPERCAELYERGLSLLPPTEVSTRLAVLHGLGDAFVRAGALERAQARFQELLRCAWLLGERAKGGAAYNRLGRIYRHQGRYEAAMAALSDGHTLFLEARDWRGVAASLDDIGQVHRLRGQYDQAMYHFQEALALRRELSDPRGIALSLYNLGELQRDAGQLREAQENLDEGLGFVRQTQDRVGISALLSALGALHHERGDAAKAEAYWEEALPLARDARDRDAQGKILARMGELALGRDETERAKAHFAEALELVRALDDRAFMPSLLRGCAEAHLRAGEAETARDLAEESLRLAREVGSRHDEGVARRVLGETFAQTLFDDTSVGVSSKVRADENLAASVDIFETLGNDLELGRALTSYGNFLLEHGDLERGREHLLRARELLGRREAARSLARAEQTIDKLP